MIIYIYREREREGENGKNSNKNNNNYNRVLGAARGSNKKWFLQSASTHSGVKEKKTLNINAVGKYNMQVVI